MLCGFNDTDWGENGLQVQVERTADGLQTICPLCLFEQDRLLDD